MAKKDNIMSKQILLTQGQFTIVDDEDFDWLNQWKWYVHNKKHTNYAARTEYSNGKSTKIYMHRIILGVQGYNLTDHVNRNGLDNRLCNLRICTPKQNCMNRRPTGKTSKRKGVYYNSQKQKWIAQICYKRKRISTYIGSYITEKAAAKAYNAKALELFGEFAYCNII